MSRECTHCGDSQAVGVGVDVGGRGWKAAAAGEEECSEESKVETELHWLKETFYNLWGRREGRNYRTLTL